MTNWESRRKRREKRDKRPLRPGRKPKPNENGPEGWKRGDCLQERDRGSHHTRYIRDANESRKVGKSFTPNKGNRTKTIERMSPGSGARSQVCQGKELLRTALQISRVSGKLARDGDSESRLGVEKL